MAVFFTLSGFLITQFLVKRPEPKPFLIRRVLRIVPLAWLAVFILFSAAWWQGSSTADAAHLFANLFFYGNLPPAKLLPGGEHLWSLAVEMHFYFGIALLIWITGARGLYLLPALAIGITIARIIVGETISIVTWHRADEILAGATLALIYFGASNLRVKRWLSAVPFWLAAALAIACTWWIFSPLAYARPYAVALMIGVTLYRAPGWLERLLISRPAVYIAQVSYASTLR